MTSIGRMNGWAAILLAPLSCVSACAGGAQIDTDPVAYVAPPVRNQPPSPPPPPPLPEAAAFTSWDEAGLNARRILTGISTVAPGPFTFDVSLDGSRKAYAVTFAYGAFDQQWRTSADEVWVGETVRANVGALWAGWWSYDDYTFAVSPPANNGWNYQTYGAWWMGMTPSVDRQAFSVGLVSPLAGVPVNGGATFSGGLLVPTGPNLYATAPVTLAVNFTGRTAQFSSSDWRDERQTYPGTALSGALAIAAGQNALSGTLTSANGAYAGPATGQFYGPNAEEVGGIFTLNPVDPAGVAVKGAFGAKR